MKIVKEVIEDYPLRETMRANNISIRKLAEKSGIDHAHISRLLKGVYRAKPETAQRLIQALLEMSTPTTLNIE